MIEKKMLEDEENILKKKNNSLKKNSKRSDLNKEKEIKIEEKEELTKGKKLHNEGKEKVKKHELKEKDLPKKEKKKLRKSEKIFLLVNILIIVGIIAFYGYRTIYYYKKSHEIQGEVTLKEKLTALDNLEFKNDGLYEKNNYYYYKGVNVNNYVYYSGRMFRIVDISDGIRMIDDETNTSLVYGINKKYSESLIYSWLNNYLSTLKDYEVYLKQNKWCNSSIDVNNYNCKDTINNYVGLLSTNDYLQAGGKNSFLNNKTYFWTINQDMDNKPLFVNSDGSINNVSSNDNGYYSYGIRPVITLRDEVLIIEGDGSLNNPFIIENLGKALLKDNSVGNYVRYNKENFRILKIEDDGITLILDGVLDIKKKYTDVMKYLNNDYLKKFNKKELVKINYRINEYNYDNMYEYMSDNKLSEYVTIPNIGDLFLTDYNDYWLNTISDNKLGLYYIIDENKMFFGDLKSNQHQIRPVIKLNVETVVSSGLGTKDKPLIIGDNNVEEN